MVGDDMREAVEARELREDPVDFIDVCEAVEGRADRAAILPGMVNWAGSVLKTSADRRVEHEQHECQKQSRRRQ
jgi:hypothetical protein